MPTITYRTGDATRPSQPMVIAHICNNQGGWGAGFVVAVSYRWVAPERAYRRWFREGTFEGKPFELGQTQFIEVKTDLWVANMIAQAGYGPSNRDQHRSDEPDESTPVRYPALKECLTEVSAFAQKKGASVHMPRIGCGLGGGKWERVEPIIEETLALQAVFVYDVPV
jgi:O-acetyl-ADP-ribose deacetylase (regulator of RNase III)